MIAESWKPLDKAFYQGEDVCGIARGLLGKVLWVAHDGGLKALVITETEAYEGITDRASHAWGGRVTARTATMYLRGGHAYVYLCYGIHWLFNVVTAGEGNPHAVLVRGGVPLTTMHDAENAKDWKGKLVSGPGRVTTYLGIDKTHNGLWLPDAGGIGLADVGIEIKTEAIVRTPRIGVDYAGEHAAWLYRFVCFLLV
ncbi:MAG: DNA-3-methyladenine glycosylase [Bacteroidia bacterium]|jgi:DNA-3-methyladenine glycosylase